MKGENMSKAFVTMLGSKNPKPFCNRLKSVGRKTLLTTAVVSGCLTAASIVKTPNETLNPFVETTDYYFINPKHHPASSNILYLFGEPEFGWNNSLSIADNINNNIKVANYKLFRDVIDPIAEKPIIPTTATALSMIGCLATKPKENAIKNPDEAKTEVV